MKRNPWRYVGDELYRQKELHVRMPEEAIGLTKYKYYSIAAMQCMMKKSIGGEFKDIVSMKAERSFRLS